MGRWTRAVAAAGIVGLTFCPCPRSVAAAGEDAAAQETWLSLAEKQGADEPAAPAGRTEWRKPVPVSFSISYTLVSDYVWRGIPLSDYRGEGREKPNHQLDVALSVNTADILGADFGAFNADFWFEWFAGQRHLNDDGDDSHLQEIDTTVSWSYEPKGCPVVSSVEVGWINYKFPRLHGDLRNTQEVFFRVGFDDGPLWKLLGCDVEGPVLSPTMTYYLDVDDVQGSWLTLGLSHDFPLADCGCGDVPVLKDLTASPSVTFGYDHRYMDALFATAHRSSRLASILYELAVSYDLSGALGIPARCGSIAVTGFLSFSQLIRDDLPGYHDQWYGGVRVGYEW